MRLMRRILLTVIIVLAAIFVCIQWIVPSTLSFYTARTAPPITRVTPTDLKDQSLSQAPGKRLSYFGYEFEIPWSDLDDTQTKLYPKDKPDKIRVDLRFRSGLRLLVTAIPPGEWANDLSTEMKLPVRQFQSTFGQSDYSFVKTLYEFTPDKMNHWAVQRVLAREQFLLIMKSVALSSSAGSGIFKVQNQEYKGFQEGNPQIRQDGIAIHLYSDEGSVEFIFLQENYPNATGITQPEINRVIQSLRKAPQHGPTVEQASTK